MIAVFAFSSPGSNQPPNGTPNFWLLNGTSTYYSNGNVGIGTTAPIGSLHDAAGHIILNIGTTAVTDIGNGVDTQSSGLGFKVAAGNVLGALINTTANGNWGADINLNVRNSGGGNFPSMPAMVIQSGGRVGIGTTSPGSALEVDSGGNMVLSMGAWTNWTPTVTQSASISLTNNYARYIRIGKTVVVQASLTLTSAGSAGNIIYIGGLPVAPANSSNLLGNFYFQSAGIVFYGGSVIIASGSTMQFIVSGNGNYMGLSPSFAIKNGDNIFINLTYESN